MRNPFIYVRKLLSVRLSLWVVFVAAIVFIGALEYMFNEAREAVRQEAINRANQILDNTVLRIDNILNRVETVADNTEEIILRNLHSPDSMWLYSRRILENNPDIYSCSVAFEPYFYESEGLYFSIYSERNENGEIEPIQEGEDDYQYFCMDWYLLPKLLDKPCWTEPYNDLNIDEDIAQETILSYGKPLKDGSGRLVGILSIDISLPRLSQLITAMKPYPHSHSIMTGRGGTFLVHPDSTKLFYQTIFTATMEKPDTTVTSLGHAMLNGEEGIRQTSYGGHSYHIFYKPLEKMGWSVAIVCPDSDIFSGYNRLKRAVRIIVVISLLLMLYIVSKIITKELKPLSQLANQTKIIAAGHFDERLPDNGRIDEIGKLTKSFGNMQHSLVKYMDELKDTTAVKERIESELRIARDIQMSMVPASFPQCKGLDMFATMTPAKEVGGDLYDYLLQDDKLYFCVGDVSGKGVPASLFMAQVTRLFRTLAAQGMMPAEICTRINEALVEGNTTYMFVTLFLGLVDLKTGHLDFCNAGHNAPVLCDEKPHFLLMLPNLPIGIAAKFTFKGEEIDSILDKPLFIYTDGLNEAENKAQEPFGDNRVLEALQQAPLEDSLQLIDQLTAMVEKHRDGAEPSDDLTMLYLRLQGSSPA